jgi:HSP20 family protein
MVWKRYLRDPFDELRRMEEWMDRVFRETWVPYYMERQALPKTAEGELAETATPFIDIKEKEGELIVNADVPGVEKEDITINIRGDTLEISAEKKMEKEEKEEGYIRRERRYTKFYRAIPLPTKVNKDEVRASLKNGVLQIELPKLAEEEAKKIEVK